MNKIKEILVILGKSILILIMGVFYIIAGTFLAIALVKYHLWIVVVPVGLFLLVRNIRKKYIKKRFFFQKQLKVVE